jgi:hypothetical protein
MAGGRNAPKNVTWVISLVLYLVALLNHFGYLPLQSHLGELAWILGFGLLLVACKVRGL